MALYLHVSEHAELKICVIHKCWINIKLIKTFLKPLRRNTISLYSEKNSAIIPARNTRLFHMLEDPHVKVSSPGDSRKAKWVSCMVHAIFLSLLLVHKPTGNKIPVWTLYSIFPSKAWGCNIKSKTCNVIRFLSKYLYVNTHTQSVCIEKRLEKYTQILKVVIFD